MKNVHPLLLIFLILASCQSEPSKDNDDSTLSAAARLDASKTLVVPWKIEMNDSTHMMELRKDPAADLTNLGPKDIVDALNLKYPDIKLIWDKQEEHKALVRIDDATFLTQASGTEGAQAYLAEVTYSLTELPGIESVVFSFKEGDHARPGVYTRKSFAGFN